MRRCAGNWRTLPCAIVRSSVILFGGTSSGAFDLSSRVMIKVYPDRRWPAFLRVLSDTVTVGWTIAWAYLGFLIYQTIMGLEAIAIHETERSEEPGKQRPVLLLLYGELAARSAQVANWLRGRGVRRGDRVLVMLGNVAPLWEVILAAIKLGAVIIPASTLLQPADLADRIERGQVGTSSPRPPGAEVRRGAGAVRGSSSRASAVPGWTRYSDASPGRPSSPRTASPGPATRCCSTSPPAPPPSPSWSRTPRPATRWGTCRPCTGSACSRATCT